MSPTTPWIVLRLAILSSLAASILLGLSGCAAPAQVTDSATNLPTDLLGSIPEDLTIDLTILPARDLQDRTQAHVARSKYIVFPDGSLHGDSGKSITVLTRPGVVRQLTRESLADLWLIVKQSGFGDIDAADYEGNPALLAPTPSSVLTVLTVRADGRIGTFVRRATIRAGAEGTDAASLRDPFDAAMTRVVRSIAALAWATDEPPDEMMVMPRRYDFGPDPYARFKQPTGVGEVPQ